MTNTPNITALLTRDLEARSSGSSGRDLYEMLMRRGIDLLGSEDALELAVKMREPSPETRRALEDLLGQTASSTDLQLTALVALAPVLEYSASRLGRGRTSDDAVGEVLAYAIEALTWAHELPVGSRADFVCRHAFSRARAQRRNQARRSVRTECLTCATDIPDPPAPYHDVAKLKLDEAVNRGVISLAECLLIDQTRGQARSIRDLAPESGESYAALQRRRHRAEVRIREYFGVGEENQ